MSRQNDIARISQCFQRDAKRRAEMRVEWPDGLKKTGAVAKTVETLLGA